MRNVAEFAENTRLSLTEPFYKILSGAYRCDTGLVCAWSASGLEFTVDCAGDISLEYTAELNGYYQCYVDGKKAERIRTEANIDGKTAVIAAKLLPGTHTVRLVQEHDIDKTGAVTVLNSVTINGVKSSAAATGEKQPYYVFLGDSVVAGKGSLGSGVYKQDDTMHSVTHGFAYLTAEALNADYTIIARGGIGLARRTTIPLLLPEILGYRNRFRDETPVTYTRKPDAVVVHVGINDGSVLPDRSALVPLLKELLVKIRQLWGKDTKIVLVYNNMHAKFNEQYVQAAQEFSGVYTLKCEKDTSGGSSREGVSGHPCAASQARNAEILAEFLKTLK